MVAGFSVHANVSIDPRDRDRLERLCRYAGRPAVATERLTALADGRLLYRLKRPWRDGTTAVIFDPQDFIAKLAVLVPVPRAHLVRFHGILGPAAALRPLVVPRAAAATVNEKPNEIRTAPAEQSSLPNNMANGPSLSQSSSTSQRNYTWSELMKRVFLVDVLQCEQCGGRMKIIAAIQSPDATRKILDCLGLPSRGPPLIHASARTEMIQSL
ncbi:MAG: transposase [Acidobacteria bacterium]|nr:transposase [Acidobacteriota bacterium]